MKNAGQIHEDGFSFLEHFSYLHILWSQGLSAAGISLLPILFFESVLRTTGHEPVNRWRQQCLGFSVGNFQVL